MIIICGITTALWYPKSKSQKETLVLLFNIGISWESYFFRKKAVQQEVKLRQYELYSFCHLDIRVKIIVPYFDWVNWQVIICGEMANLTFWVYRDDKIRENAMLIIDCFLGLVAAQRNVWFYNFTFLAQFTFSKVFKSKRQIC